MKYYSVGFRVLTKISSLTCIGATLLLIAYCTWQYCKNEDSSVVRFAEYNHGKESIYPGITLCFKDFLKPDIFSCYFEKTMYESFINGRDIDENALKKICYLGTRGGRQPTLIPNPSRPILRPPSNPISIDPDELVSNFTRKLENTYENNDVKNIYDYLLFCTMTTYQLGWNAYHFPSNRSLGNTSWIPHFYPSLSSPQKRCWTFEPPYSSNDKMISYGVMFNKSIFDGSKRPWYKRFEIRLSYPGQQLTSPSVKSNWGKKESEKDYTMKFEIQNIVVMKRRNKLTESCEEDWKQNDKVLIEKMLSDVKCTLPHWNMNSTFPICQKEQLPRIETKFRQIRNNMPPCQEIEKILCTYEETEGISDFVDYLNCPYLSDVQHDQCISDYLKQYGIGLIHDVNGMHDIIQVMISFQGSTYMEITQNRAYDGQNLIGNAGGYVGLFLGVALIQLPLALESLFQMLK